MLKYGHYMSWFARLVNRSRSEKRPEVCTCILTEEKTSMILNGERKALLCGNIVVTGIKEMKLCNECNRDFL